MVKVEFPNLFQVVRPELNALESYLQDDLQQAREGVREVVGHLLSGGGKRIRPALVFLAARFGHNVDASQIMKVAAATEMIHMATLIHDDILDEALLRRNVATVHTVWNRRVAILAGDYLFARSLGLLAETREPEATLIMSAVVRQMCDGEIQQNVAALGGDLPTEADYLDRIGKKTALFLAESCRLGALMAGAEEWKQRVLYTFGWSMGLGFQIVDDLLDFTATSVAFGKVVGGDLRSGVLTLPLIHGLVNSQEPERTRLTKLATARAAGQDEWAEMQSILGRSGSFAYAQDVAFRLVREAADSLGVLPANEAREALLSMASYVVEREA